MSRGRRLQAALQAAPCNVDEQAAMVDLLRAAHPVALVLLTTWTITGLAFAWRLAAEPDVWRALMLVVCVGNGGWALHLTSRARRALHKLK